MDFRREQFRLVEGGVGRGLYVAEHDALVLVGGELLLGEEVEGDGHEDDDCPQSEHDRSVAQRPGERLGVEPADRFETPVDHSREAFLGVACPKQPRAHHRRQRQRDDTGDDHRAGERKGKLAE